MNPDHPGPREREPPDRYDRNKQYVRPNTPKRSTKAIISRFEASDTNVKNVGLGGYLHQVHARSNHNMDLSDTQLEDLKENLIASHRKILPGQRPKAKDWFDVTKSQQNLEKEEVPRESTLLGLAPTAGGCSILPLRKKD